MKNEIKNTHYQVQVFNRPKAFLGRPIWTAKETITVKKCKEIITNLEKAFGKEVPKISVIISSASPRKEAVYFSKSNCLQIWEDDEPVYENRNGMICRDRVALADCLC